MKKVFSSKEQALRNNLRKRKQQKDQRMLQSNNNKEVVGKSMDKIKIIGGNPLNGSLKVSGSKNSALPILIAAILCDEEVVINNVPNLSDIHVVLDILKELNAEVSYKNNQAILNARSINKQETSYELASKMRASVLVLGPLLSKYGYAEVPLPGGCSIGMRPVDLHIEALEKMGAKIKVDHGYIVAEAKDGLRGTNINFEKVSVGATENIMIAATYAKGKTVLTNVSKEPEIVDLANFLNAMGGKVEGAGTDIITITEVESLKGCTHKVIADRIQAGSYAIAAVATKGRVILEDFDINLWGEFLTKLEEAGAKIKDLGGNKIECSYNKKIKALDIATAPHPGFSTDLQAPWMVLMAVANGKSIIEENIFENRFTHAPELIRMNADIVLKDNNIAVVNGVERLKSAEVKSTDLRASFALLVAAMVAEGESTIIKLHHLDRGYVEAVANLSKLGANIKRGENI